MRGPTGKSARRTTSTKAKEDRGKEHNGHRRSGKGEGRERRRSSTAEKEKRRKEKELAGERVGGSA